MDEQLSPHEIAGELSKKGYRVLLAVQSNGGEATTSEVTEQISMRAQLVNYYYEELIDHCLLRKIEADAPPGQLPRKSHTYQLTERGRETLSAAHDDYGLDPLEEGEVRRRFDKFEERIDRLEQRVDQVVAKQADAEEDIEGIGQALKEVIEQFRELRDDVRDPT